MTQDGESDRDWLCRIVGRRPLLWAAGSHLFFALLLFSPFFLEGKVLVGSTDNYFHAWVNYLFSRQTLANGDVGMWNPNILCGIDFTASPHNHMRCPLDWPLFLLPAHYFLHGLTVQVFLLVFLSRDSPYSPQTDDPRRVLRGCRPCGRLSGKQLEPLFLQGRVDTD